MTRFVVYNLCIYSTPVLLPGNQVMSPYYIITTGILHDPACDNCAQKLEPNLEGTRVVIE